MGVMLGLSTLALRDVAFGAAGAGGLEYGAAAIQAVTELLRSRFVSQGSRLADALRLANHRAWQTLEMALAGDSFWQRCRTVIAHADEKALRRELQAYFQALKLPQGDPARFCKQCLEEVRSARKRGLLEDAKLDPARLAEHAGKLVQFREAHEILAAERKILKYVCDSLGRAGCANLAALIDLQPSPDESLLTASVRYFFRRAVEDDPKLFQGLAFAQLEQIQQKQQHHFDAIRDLLARHGDHLENLLGDLQAEMSAVHSAVLDVRQEQQRQAGRHEELYQAVMNLQQRLDLMHQSLRPRDSLSIRGDVERRLVKELVHRIRSLPEEQRRDMPALLNAVGMLQVAAGEFQQAEKEFLAVAEIVDDASAEAEAHFNAYRAALERRDWAAALDALIRAVKLERARFEPFPWRKYRPERILGAGGFGVAFLCRHTRINELVVVKALNPDELARDLAEVFNEARLLRQMNHPNIIGLRDCDFADESQTRPYLEMDYFESQTLEEYVQQHGGLSEADLDQVARQLAEGLRAAHDRGVLHRDVKPGNILVRKDGDRWSVKLIDFGLALPYDRLSGSTASGTLRGESIAGTLDYAAPEQLGKLPNVPVSRASDVFGFARTCYFALFGTPYPKAKHFERLTPAWRQLLDDCTSDLPHERPADFPSVLERWPGSPQATRVVPTAPPGASGRQLWDQIVHQASQMFTSAFSRHATETKRAAPTVSGPKTPDVVPVPPESTPAPVLEVLPAKPPPEVQPAADVLEVLPVQPINPPRPKPTATPKSKPKSE